MTFDAIREYSSHYSVILAAGVTARYWSIEITDTGNSDGYVEIGRVGLWGIAPAVNMSWGVQYGIRDNSVSDYSLSGDFIYDHAAATHGQFLLDFDVTQSGTLCMRL